MSTDANLTPDGQEIREMFKDVPTAKAASPSRPQDELYGRGGIKVNHPEIIGTGDRAPEGGNNATFSVVVVYLGFAHSATVNGKIGDRIP